MRTTVKVIESGRVTLPAAVRDGLNVSEGDFVELDVRPVNATAVR